MKVQAPPDCWRSAPRLPASWQRPKSRRDLLPGFRVAELPRLLFEQFGFAASSRQRAKPRTGRGRTSPGLPARFALPQLLVEQLGSQQQQQQAAREAREQEGRTTLSKSEGRHSLRKEGTPSRKTTHSPGGRY